MSSPKAPKPPDTVSAAREQGQQNIEAARTTAALNRVNQVGPEGTVTFSRDPSNPDQYTQTTQLSPEQQRIYDAQTSATGSRAQAAGQNFNLYGGNLGQGINTSGLPARQFSAGPTDQMGSINARSVGTDRIQTNNLRPLPGANDFSAERQRVEDALYGRSTQRLDDQFGRREEDLRSQLLNRGLREGTQAYNDAMLDFGRERQDSYADARDRAILAGGQEQSRLYGQDLSARQQQFGENQSVAQFSNQSANQNFQNELQRSGFFNDAQQQEFMQRLADAQLANQQRDAGINEQVTDQQQTLQGLDFLYGGGGAMSPQAFAPGTSGGVAPTDIYGAIQDQYSNQLSNYSQRAQQAAQQQQAIASIAAAFIGASDPRLKTDIERIGELPNGLPIYRFRYHNDPVMRTGVMSTDVRKVMPEAVIVGEDGYDRVDYAAIGAKHLLEAA